MIPIKIKHYFRILSFISIAGVMLASNKTEAQSKPPLDHSVYDEWQRIGSEVLSSDGKWIAYTIEPQEGDGSLVISSTRGNNKVIIERGYGQEFTADNRFVVFKIKPPYAATREARIHKRKESEFPKDSLGILELERPGVLKFPDLKSFKIPEEPNKWIAWLQEKTLNDSTDRSLSADSSSTGPDTLGKIYRQPVEQKPNPKRKQRVLAEKKDEGFFVPDSFTGDFGFRPDSSSRNKKITDLVIFQPLNRTMITLEDVSEFSWSKNGKILIAAMGGNNKGASKGMLIWRSPENRIDTISIGGYDFRHLVADEKGYQVAFVAERDSGQKAAQQFYKLWYWRNGDDSATSLVSKNSPGMKLGFSISPDATLKFSKSGSRLFFGTSRVVAPRDTTVPEIDRVKVDIWHYNDDYLQPKQLKNLSKEQKRSYDALYDFNWKRMVQLADPEMPEVLKTESGEGDWFAGVSDVGKRISEQWEGKTRKDIYSVNPLNGKRTLVKKDVYGRVLLSPTGRFITWYDEEARQYFSWYDGHMLNISAKVPVKLYDEENDRPTEPTPYGFVTWIEDEKAVLVYDRYDIWQLDPRRQSKPINLTEGRKNKIIYRYVSTNPETRFIAADEMILLSTFDFTTKREGLSQLNMSDGQLKAAIPPGPFSFHSIKKSKDSSWYCFTKESYIIPPDIYTSHELIDENRLSHINPQQSGYNWGTASLYSWKAYDGKMAEGILYKPENYNPDRKYPLICYFYEKLSDRLYDYIPPAPTPSRINISFFVSRGYLVFAPDIRYTIGHPGESAYNYIVSGVRSIVRKGWVDSTRIGIQGQSWGGYEVAYLVTRTKLFKAAWSGAPVANMTSAYGGIRWGTGMNRQFQYEKTQSRIGATLWEKPQLYLENSPLFHLRKVTTPLVIMANDNDGAVPWYQGIELFTGLRRLGKKVWLINYNGEEHNVVERKNRKDLQIREQQFFDWLLKNEKPASWLVDGVPATEKGIDEGLEIK